MKRPDNPVIGKLEGTIADIHLCAQQLAELHSRLRAEARSISEIRNKRKRINVAIYAYWHLPEIPAADLALGGTGHDHPSYLLRLAGPVTAGITCDGCSKEVPITSRTQMRQARDRIRHNKAKWLEGYRVLCPDCEAVLNKTRRAKYPELDGYIKQVGESA